MKTRKKVLCGILAVLLVLAFAMTVVGCDEDDPNSGTAPTITTAALPNGTVNTAYSQTLEASGDTPITWSVEGALPNGLTLSTAGVISGNPTMANTFNFTVKATNAAGNDIKALSIVISGGSSEGEGTAPTITTTSLPNGTVNTAYSQTLEASGDTPITWSVEGALPNGLTLSTAGVISGNPTMANTFNFTVKATNAAGNDTKQLSITIESAPVPPTITTTSLPNGTVGTAYSQTLTASGDTPITWSITSGALPDGLTLNASTGIISGEPENTGITANFNSSFVVKAENAAGNDIKALSIVISGGSAPIVLEFRSDTDIGGDVDIWTSEYEITSLVTGGITKDDVWTLEYTFSSNVAITSGLYLNLIDNGSGDWEQLSSYTDIIGSGIAANTRVSGTVNFNANKSSSSTGTRKIMLEVTVSPDSNAAGKPTLTFTNFSLERTVLAGSVKKMTFARYTGDGYDNWQYLYYIPSSITGGKITTGDSYTLTYSFRSNVAITEVGLILVDTTETAGWWNELSLAQGINDITANSNPPKSGQITITATGTASSDAPDANKLFFVVDYTKAAGEPTLTFTQFSLVKNNTP